MLLAQYMIKLNSIISTTYLCKHIKLCILLKSVYGHVCAYIKSLEGNTSKCSQGLTLWGCHLNWLYLFKFLTMFYFYCQKKKKMFFKKTKAEGGLKMSL